MTIEATVELEGVEGREAEFVLHFLLDGAAAGEASTTDLAWTYENVGLGQHTLGVRLATLDGEPYPDAADEVHVVVSADVPCAADSDCVGLVSFCTTATCDIPSARCVSAPAQSGATCDDSHDCTTIDTCIGGQCVGQAADCDDGDPCTDDTCTDADGCTSTQNTGPCEDGNPCTEGDVCQEGKCSPGLDVCVSCWSDADCEAQDDGNPCNGVLRCTEGDCVLDSDTVVHCDTNEYCLAASCNPETGGCQTFPANEEHACDDGDACFSSDVCVAGKCVGWPVLCDDENPCTNDVCNSAAGGCHHVPGTGPCDDGDACTLGDICDGGQCKPQALKSCDDSNPCTADTCSPSNGTCQNTPVKATCDDGNPCTTEDTCTLGKCIGGAPVSCDDGDSCTVDSCTPASGGCSHGPVECDDENPCTDDSCSPQSGCTTTVHACDDGNACTDDACNPTVGCTATLLACDDGDICTTESCDPATGCYHVPLDCDDSDPCTADDCAVSGCVNVPKDCDDGNPCTSDTCTGLVGVCTYAPNEEPCDDGDACTVDDHCNAGTCVPGTLDPTCP